MKRHTLIILFYSLLAFITLYPLIFQNGMSGAGYDYFHTHWNFWWMRQALTSSELSLYETDYVMTPYTTNLVYTTLAAFWYPVWAVFEPFIGTLTAMTIIIALGCFLNGYVFYLFLRHEKVAVPIALIGGAVLQTTPLVKYFYYNSHINLMNWFWLPIHIWLWQQTVSAVMNRRRIVLWVLVQGVALWAMVITDLQLPLFLMFLIVPYGIYTLVQAYDVLPWRVIQLCLAGGMSILLALGLLWFAGPLPYILSFEGTLIPGHVADRPGIPLSGFLWADDVWWLWDVPTLGGFVLLMVVITLLTHRRFTKHAHNTERWLWFFMMFPPMILAMGPTLEITQSLQTGITLPYTWLHGLTEGMFRMPWRLAPIYIIAATLFVGKSLSLWLPFVPSNQRRVLYSGAFLVMVASLRLFHAGPTQEIVPTYDFYEQMGDEALDYVVIEAPTAAGTGELLIGDDRAIAFQYYGVVHGKRMINGFFARAPLEHFWYLRTDDPLLSWLGQRRYLEPEAVEAELRRIIYEWPVGYIVIHRDYIGYEMPANREIIGYFNALPDLLCPVFIEKDAIVYRSAWHPAGCPQRTPPQTENGAYRIDMGVPDDDRFIGSGWYWQEDIAGIHIRWAGEFPQAQLFAELPAGDYRFAFAAQAYDSPNEVIVSINGQVIDRVTIDTGTLQTITFDKRVSVDRPLTITLDYAHTTPAPGERTLAIMVDWVQFTPYSDH